MCTFWSIEFLKTTTTYTVPNVPRSDQMGTQGIQNMAARAALHRPGSSGYVAVQRCFFVPNQFLLNPGSGWWTMMIWFGWLHMIKCDSISLCNLMLCVYCLYLIACDHAWLIKIGNHAQLIINDYILLLCFSKHV